MSAFARRVVRDLLPPAAVRLASRLANAIRGAPFEYAGLAWPVQFKAEGWGAQGVQGNREQTWPAFLSSVESTTLLGLSEQDLRAPHLISIDVQSLYLAYGYCLGLACHDKSAATVLDWGGSVGNYYVIAKSLNPGVTFDYHSVDLPGACAVGRRLLPEVTFHDDRSWETATYDFVFSSSSLQYLDDWRPTVAALVRSSRRYLYITRMPFVLGGPSFVAVQRVPQYGTSYPGWIINRDEFVRFVEGQGMRLRRQFVNHPGPVIKGAPEQNLYMGFFFEK